MTKMFQEKVSNHKLARGCRAGAPRQLYHALRKFPKPYPTKKAWIEIQALDLLTPLLTEN